MKVPSRIYIDIETIPSNREVSVELAQPTEDDVKIGNRKGDTAREYKMTRLKELSEKWKEDLEKLRLKAVEDLRKESLDSLKGKILCVGIAFDDEAPLIIQGSEKEIIGSLNEQLRNYGDQIIGSTVIGFNVRNFDLEWLWHKSIQYNKEFLKWFLRTVNVVDLSEEIRYNKYNKKFYKFDVICKFLGIESKTIMSGDQVYDYWLDGKLEDIFAYCAEDVKAVRELHKRVKL